MGAGSQVHELNAPPRSGTSGGELCRLTIFIRETDHYHHRPLYAEIVHRARKAGLTGASVFRGVLGFSAPDPPRNRRLSLCEYVPVVIVVVDEGEHIKAFLALLDDVIDSGVATLESVRTRQ